MKKNFILLMAFALLGISMSAKPVSQETAQRLGRLFVTANFELTRQSTELNLVYAAIAERGEACYYVFNVGEKGFVIMSADDNYRPIIAYSDERTFNIDDMAPALVDHLELIRQGIMEASQASSAKASVAADWAMLEKTGRLVSRHGGREDEYLVETQWNQNYPYNYFCPAASDGPGGHCYAGCVATAAGQLMRYWNHPAHGQGSHTYVPEDHPEYGPLTVNFGAATYDWENMPLTITADSPQEQIEAVAQLIYHAGVSVDMNYRPGSSGAVTGRLCESMPAYFFYTNQMANLYRENYSHEGYMQLIVNAIDMRWPMVHRGGGHAYVLDGYNDNDMVHFNWGWSGSNDGWYNVDDHNYTDGESVIYNYVPAEIYAATPKAPTNLTGTPSNDNSLTATISWTNPTQTLTNQTLASIDQIVVTRDGQVVYSDENVTPGASMSFVDESIPYFDVYDYAVYAVTDGHHGALAYLDKVLVGPTCNWKIIMQSSAFQGWNGGYVSLLSKTGKEIRRMTITNSATQSLEFATPLGDVGFAWTAPATTVNSIAVIIKDSDNSTVFTYQGNSSGMEEGVFFVASNDCGNEQPYVAPYDLRADMVDGNAVLTWEVEGATPDLGYNIYRDEQLYAMVNDPESHTYVDEGITEGHCYTVAGIGMGGETEQSNETCASAGDCMAATNFYYEYTGNNYRIKLSWDRPAESEGLTGYFLYRKRGEEGAYERIKLLGSSATSYTDNTANQEGDYYYRLYAYYSATDCTSSPASVRYNPNLFYLHVYYSPTGLDENGLLALNLFPNPADHSFSIESEGMNHVSVYNTLGQLIFDAIADGHAMRVNVSDWNEGMYLVKVQSPNGQAIRRITIIH